jgi:hypothetical protein
MRRNSHRYWLVMVVAVFELFVVAEILVAVMVMVLGILVVRIQVLVLTKYW